MVDATVKDQEEWDDSLAVQISLPAGGPARSAINRIIRTSYSFVMRRSHWQVVALGLAAAVLLIGFVDFITGSDVSLSVIYAFPIIVAAWALGRPFALMLIVVSVVLWIWGDIVAGNIYHNPVVPLWNAVIRFLFYYILVELLLGLRAMQANLESRVRERTAALTNEMRERNKLEQAILEISEREQRRVGQDLHDGLCQHLAGTSYASQVLSERLSSQGRPEAADAQAVVRLVDDAISLSRSVARGLHSIDARADGLMEALDEFAMTTSELFHVDCRFASDSPVLVADPAVASQLFRIAQEGVRNAVKHGPASKIAIYLDAQEDGISLRVEDNGPGFSSKPGSQDGMGLRIMAYRAKLIGAHFNIGSSRGGGTNLSCTLPGRHAGGVVHD